MGLEISLANGVPNVANPNDAGQALTAISGPLLDYFTFTYNPAVRTFSGIQKAPIPGNSSFEAVIQYRVASNTFIGAPFNGANVNVTPPGFTQPQPEANDQANSYTFVDAKDFGDAPLSYGAAVHTIDVNAANNQFAYLGSVVDPEAGYQASVDALGDDNNQTGGLNADDEDGVVFPASLTAGTSYSIPVTATLNGATFSAINAWIDWNNDGDFLDSGEQVITNQVVVVSGTQNYSITVPAGTADGTYYARFRLGTFGLNATQAASWGEVEDYRIVVGTPSLPAIDLVKTGTLNLGGDGVANAGDTISYVFTVSNTGNVPLTGVTVSDPLITVTGGPISLAPGASDSTTFTGSYTLAQANINAGTFTNTATATGTPPTGPAVTDTDDDTQTLPAAPVLKLEKTATPTTFTGVGVIISYSYVLTNEGNVTLFAPYTVTDNKVTVTCPSTPASIPPSGTVTCTASTVTTQVDVDAELITNVATGKAKDGAGADVTSDEDSETVTGPARAPAIDLQKTGTLNLGSDGVLNAGDTISYVFRVQNTGNVTLSNVMVTDGNPNVIVAGGPIASLAPQAVDSTTFTGTYTLTQADVDAGTFTNTATVTGTPPTGANVTDTDDDTQTLGGTPVLGLVKTVPSFVDADGSGTVTVGDTLNYRFVATNNGNVTLTGVTITDPLAGLSALSCSPLQPATLQPGGQLICTATYVVKQADGVAGRVVNTATADSDQTPPTEASVTTPVAPPSVLVCDANGDSRIDRTDITLVSRARGQSVQPGDPRDADGDGVITFLDQKICIARQAP